MIGLQQDFDMHSGDSRDLEITVVDENDAAVDVSAATMTWELSKLDSSGTLPAPRGAALVTKTVGSGITITDGPNGELTVALDPADTADLRGDHYHELQIVTGGKTSTVLFGKVAVLKDLVE